MRQKIVAGNWKMNNDFQEAEDLLFDIVDLLKVNGKGETVVIACPPAVYLEMATDIAIENDFLIGAQNCSQFDSGAYTGEISPVMISSIGVTHVIIGHSERRAYFGETNQIISAKVDAVIRNEIVPIFCCGEVKSERESGIHFDVVKRQVSEALFHLEGEKIENLIIAYEPVWAIGTGLTATPEQAQEMHAFIRGIIGGRYGEKVSANSTILYGGSCNAKNARELFSQPDVDGGLIGGASLKAEDFVTIINSF
ncbi:MAG: triose-phosphate isomerase [Bacteroidales bacterium]